MEKPQPFFGSSTCVICWSNLKSNLGLKSCENFVIVMKNVLKFVSVNDTVNDMLIFLCLVILHIIKTNDPKKTWSSTILHCVKSVQIRSYLWSAFSCIQSEYRKIRTRNNSVFGHFSCNVAVTLLMVLIFWIPVPFIYHLCQMVFLDGPKAR